MKKIALLSLLIGVLSFVLLDFKPVYAATCDADENLYLNVFTNGRDSIDKSIGVTQESAVSTTNVLVTSLLSVASVGMTSSAGNCMKVSLLDNIRDVNAQKDSPGALQYAVSMMASSFSGVPAESIPGYYAQMLLPKELVSGSTAYAGANCGDKGLLTAPPDCRSASIYFGEDQNFGIGISTLWGMSFAFAMVIVVFVLIVSGFMIMFRSKIGGQVVVTVSMALQNIVIATGMALASYALGVFFVNLSKFLILLFANVFVTVLMTQDPGYGLLFGGTIAQIGPITLDSPVGFLTFINEPLGLSAKLLFVLLVGDGVGALETVTSNFGLTFTSIPSALSSWISNIVGGIVTGFNLAGVGIVLLISRIIITGGIFIASIRIFWTVLKIYIKMAIDIVLAPVLFVLMAIPGKNTGISEWIGRMFKNALAPPLMVVAINMIIYITLKLAFMVGGNSLTGGPVTAVSGGSLSGGADSGTLISFFWGMMSVGMGLHGIIMLVLLNMVPSIPKAMEDLFAAKSSGSMLKAGEEVSKRLQSIPLLGTAMK
ncbi:hypothetical protein COZ14_04760 [Candidatus Dojkabacteria bacterium CG_4_10_14_3_um_filter_Dojkabacteria_WS6_41_9]|uniref:TrbL/VirB6 plasmid conjugal transfer protein n=1 Tax=Candidatus Dojkabacteria bacterium CG_4_10_14_0_2_um_filter_Dojkabacteria_WS6_41_15 TaxID=2014249 RepID=A0A2M7W207_9BACT|nr:MAG: hypothetical protein COZ14_04760 [Candidatus Dojkabacteria bacterium CG_4_10_14_3_um_filter_Dojkabacteria_WS6_41_9]PJA14125.1 MAG: hypothetical protein COX64_02415 [Candidatus Dojkabacteria bacterium CG_4_10_14_0_2_um_filter_Dojkabacteria_WS6_41_15]